jgi:predicted porin
MQHSLFSPSRLLSSVVLLTVFAAFSTPSLAQLITDDTGTQGSGGNELVMAYSRDRTRVDGQTARAHSVPATYTYGVTDTIEIYAGVVYSRIRAPGDDVNGFGNTAIGAKWRFFENETSGTSLAIAPALAFPVSSQREDDGLGAGRTSGNLTFILSQDAPFGSVHFNAGVGRDRYRHSDNATNRHFSVSPVWNVSEKWALALDVGVDLSRSDGHTARSKYIDIDATYSLNKDMDLQFGFMRATDDEHPKSRTHSVVAMLYWRF